MAEWIFWVLMALMVIATVVGISVISYWRGYCRALREILDDRPSTPAVDRNAAFAAFIDDQRRKANQQ